MSEEQCGRCLYWDHRAEAEVDAHTGYCTIHEMMKADTSHCPEFVLRTPTAMQRYMDELYDDGTDYGNVDLGSP